MAIPRIYHPQPLQPGTRVVLTGQAADHVSRVLRLSAGDQIQLFAGDGRDFDATVDGPVRDGLRVQVGQAQAVQTESPLRVTLMQGICRGQKMDLVVQKATELGVAAIYPLQCERSVVRLRGERAARRREHWLGVATGAAEQCGRAIVPHVHPADSLAAAIAALPDAARRLLLDPEGRGGLSHSGSATQKLVLLVGPEGGLSPAEHDLATGAGFVPVRMGPRVLRTETAPLAALSVLQYLYGDLGKT
jgi:16S rRNA (uracil1498-N3)-methyltransferase